MTVSELIEKLKNYPMDMQVWGAMEESGWNYDEEIGSYEVATIKEGPLVQVERWTAEDGQEVVRLS